MNSEEDLIRLAQAGDTDAFCLLAETHERRVYALALHYCRGRQDAEDLSQEVWLKAYAAISTFRSESSFYTWLRKIMINCFLNHRRARSFQLPEQISDALDADSVTEESFGSVSTLERNVQNHLVVGRVMQVLSEVTPQQRLIFLLKHQEGMTYEEIAKAVGCSAGTVKKSVSRTVTKLRQCLGVNHESTRYVSCGASEYPIGS